MPEHTTPGQTCYAAYAHALNLQRDLTWAQMPLKHQRAWDAAAQAVLREQACWQFALGQQVICAEEPGVVWQIVKRHRHESTASVWVTYDLYLREDVAHHGRVRMAYEPDLGAYQPQEDHEQL